MLNYLFNYRYIVVPFVGSGPVAARTIVETPHRSVYLRSGV